MSDKTKLLAQTLGLAAAIGGPYSAMDFKMPKPKKQRGTAVGCSQCGRTLTTLYRAKDGTMICKICKEANEKDGNT